MLKASRRRRDLVNIVEGAKVGCKCACGVDFVGSRLCVCVCVEFEYSLLMEWKGHSVHLCGGRNTLIVPTSHCTYLSLCLILIVPAWPMQRRTTML